MYLRNQYAFFSNRSYERFPSKLIHQRRLAYINGFPAGLLKNGRGCPAGWESFVVEGGTALTPSTPRLNMETSMPFLMMFRDANDIYRGLSFEERQRLMEQWNAWYDDLAARGKVQHGHPLEPQTRLVSGRRGERVVDGPFAEAKEAIGGYFLLTVSSLEEATQIAQNCPSLPLGMVIELRPIAGACHALGARGRPLQTTASSN